MISDQHKGLSKTQNIVIRFNGSADFSDVQKEIAKLETAYGRLGKSMQAQRNMADPQDKVELYHKQRQQLAELRAEFNTSAAASGNWNVQQVKTISLTEDLTNKISQQKLGLGDLRRNWKTVTGEMVKEQAALRNSMAVQTGGNMFGKQTVDLYTPRTINAELDKSRLKYGLINAAIASAAHQTVNWGKNTQWAGRQITVGLTVPLGMAAVGAAALALQVDQNLTRIAKVYDTTATTAAGTETELATLRTNSLRLSTDMAQEYGMAMENVLDIEAQLASTGLNGRDLMRSTGEAVRIAALGEMDYQRAIDMTISLQTAFGLSNDQVTESFNLMNAVENATSLTIEDIAEATPRAASALAALGGSVSDMTVMLVAMKESGVDAAEGANALKSATSRLLNPTAAAVSYFQDQFGINLESVVNAAGGNIYKIMQDLAGMTQGYSNLAKQRGIQELFGTYQFNRVTALWDNLGTAMRDTTGQANQTSAAMRTVGMSTSDLADIADQEVERWQNSIQGRFKTALEGIKAELVPLGMTVLQAITPIMQAVSGLISGFNGLSGPVKNILLIGAAALATAGPLLMMVGIFANLFGSVTKFTTGLGNMFLKFKPMTAASRAAAMMHRESTSAFNAEGRATAVLAANINTLTVAMEANAVAAGAMARINADGTATIGTRTIVKDANGRTRYGAGSGNDEFGKPLANRAISLGDAALLSSAAKSSENIAANGEKAKRSFGLASKAAGALTVASIGMAMFADQSSKANQNITAILGTGALLTSMFPGWTKALANVSGSAASGAGRIRQMGSALMGFGSTALRIFGPIGIIAGGIALLISFVSHLNDANEAQKKLNNNAELMGTLYGATAITPEAVIPVGQNQANATGANELRDLAAEGDETAAALVEAASHVTNASQAMSLALNQALTGISNSTINGEQARDYMRRILVLAADSANLDSVTLDELNLVIDQVNLENPEEFRQGFLDVINTNAQAAFSGVEQSGLGNQFRNWILDENTMGGFTRGFGNLVLGEDDAAEMFNNTQDFWQANITNLANSVNLALSNAGENDFMKNEIFDGLQESMHTSFRNEIEGFNQTIGTDFSEQDFDFFRKWIEENGNLDGLDLENALGFELDPVEMAALEATVNGQTEAYQEFMDQILDLLNISGEMRDSIRTIADLQRYLAKETMSATYAQAKYQAAIKKSVSGHRKLTTEQRHAITEAALLATGLDLATAAAMGLFGLNMGNLKMYIKEAADLAAGITGAGAKGVARPSKKIGADDPNSERGRERRQKALDAETKAIQEAGDARSEALSKAADAANKAADKAAKAEDKMFKAREKSLDNYWENIEKTTDARQKAQTDGLEAAFDSRKKVIEDQINVEQEAEKIRQAIFDAEEKRISRMAQRANRGIDFNAALNSGNLDEAAKIYNDMSAAESGWAMDDSKDNSQSASEKRIEDLNAQIEMVSKEKDARLEALKLVQDAEREANKERREAAQEQLSLEQEIANERRDAAQEAARESQQNAQDAARDATEAALEAAQARFDAVTASAGKLNAMRVKSEKDTNGKIKESDADIISDKKKKVQQYQDWLESKEHVINSTFGEIQTKSQRAAITEKKKKIEDYREWQRRNDQQVGDNYGTINTRTIDAALTENKLKQIKAATEQNTRDVQIGQNLTAQLGSGAENGRLKMAAKMTEFQTDTNARFAAVGGRLGTEVNAGATSGKIMASARMEELVNGPGSSLNAKFGWVGGQLAGHLLNGAQAGRDRSMAWVDWVGAGNDISNKISSTVGLDAGGLKNWLKTGDYPGANWKKAMSRHEGGVVLHGGGSPSWSSKDRTGVPRSASLYPTEIPAILKRGEYVVNEKSTRANAGLLDQINSGKGKAVQVAHGPAVVRHEGGTWPGFGLSAMAGAGAAEMQANRTLLAVQDLIYYAKKKESAAMAGNGKTGDIAGFQAGSGGGGGSNGVFRTKNRNFPARQWMVPSANALAAKAHVQRNFPGVGSIGVVGSRSITSDHPWGKAIDNMIPNYKSPSGIALGTAIADWFVANPNVFGTKYVIWRDRIASDDGKGWQRYGHPSGGGGDTLQHRDHPHVSFYHGGGEADALKVPQLKTGGYIKYDNTMANLHKNESVLTAPLTQKFKAGLDVAAGGESGYNVTIDLRGSYIKEEVDIEQAVYTAINKRESRMGRRRVV